MIYVINLPMSALSISETIAQFKLIQQKGSSFPIRSLLHIKTVLTPAGQFLLEQRNDVNKLLAQHPQSTMSIDPV